MIYQLAKYGLASAEFLHAALHIQVLLGLGKLYTVSELEAKRDYFIMDAGTVAVSGLFLLFTSAYGWTEIFLPVFLHLALHMYYISKWTINQSFFIESIREYSAEKNHKLRLEKDGMIMYIYNSSGTLFDIVVHLYMMHMILN